MQCIVTRYEQYILFINIEEYIREKKVKTIEMLCTFLKEEIVFSFAADLEGRAQGDLDP